LSYYVVCFTAQAAPRWWTKILHPKALHVFALKWTGKHWVMVHPRIAYTEVQVLDYKNESDLPTIVSKMEIEGALRIDFDHLDTDCIRVPWLFTPWTCVEQVKALIGVRSFWVLTPRQLWRYLKRGL
jgi:hypothetical protein